MRITRDALEFHGDQGGHAMSRWSIRMSTAVGTPQDRPASRAAASPSRT